eukprot:493280-Prorocentrum_lima.AAC.1
MIQLLRKHRQNSCMRCIGKPNADGEPSQADPPGEGDSTAANNHPTQYRDTCVPLASTSTTLLKPL